MAEEAAQKVLLFISHQPDNLKVATSFLKKRNFIVHIVSDVKDAIPQVFDLKPDFVFVSWDHVDRKAQMLPKILAQSTASIIVPFINKNTKDAIFKIEQCPYTPKLYPPLSGPSVERLIMKSTKEDADYLEKVKKFKSAESKAELARVQKNLAESEAAEAAEAASAIDAAAAELPPAPENSQITEMNSIESEVSSPELSQDEIQNNLEQRNQTLEEEKQPLTEEQKLNLQKSIDDQVKPSLESVLSAKEEAEGEAGVKPKKQVRKGPMVFKNELSQFQKGPAIYISKGTPVQKKPAKAAVEKQFEVEEKTIADGEFPPSNNHVHCISIICPTWCGYFLIASTTALDFPTIELVFADWLTTQMKNLDEISERDYFNFDDVEDGTLAEIKKMADYSEVIQAHGHDFSICFFSVEPKDMKIDFSSDRNYIEVYTRDIPPQAALNFDLLLHLPENQKYLLFTLKEMALSEDQRSRLLTRNVTKLFTKLENEYEYRRFLVMKTFSRLFDVINSRLSGQ